MNTLDAASVVLEDACYCVDFKCRIALCAAMKCDLFHYGVCEDKVACLRCKDLYFILVKHARCCTEGSGACGVPSCLEIRLADQWKTWIERVDENENEEETHEILRLLRHGGSCKKRRANCKQCCLLKYVRMHIECLYGVPQRACLK